MTMRTQMAVLLLGQALDALTLLVAWRLLERIGPVDVSERNPIALFIIGIGGVNLMALVKVATGSALLWRHRAYEGRHSPVLRWLIPAAVCSGYLGAAFNTMAIWRLA